MLDLIYTIQAKLVAEGISIDHILAMIIGLFVMFVVGYLVECNNSEKVK